MFRRTTAAGRRPARRGAILLVVLAMLALFAVIGLAFVMYAESAATSASVSREAFNTTDESITGIGTVGGGSGIPASELQKASHAFLEQLLFPIPDIDPNSSTEPITSMSALRGYEMARMVWGFNAADPANNCVAYNGLGLFHETISLPGGATIPRRDVINWSWQFDRTTPANSRIIDPEHSSLNPRTDPTAAIPAANVFVGKNANYTYPDRNNAYVAVTDPNTGRVIVPSFLRPSLFNATAQPNAGLRLAPPQSVVGATVPIHNGIASATDDDWLNLSGRYKILRPRPFDHTFDSGDGRGSVTDFPYPPPNPDGTVTGDVQNLRWAGGQQKNDSVWLYTGAQPFQWRNRWVVPLVAPIILPLDGRLNLNVAGNLLNAVNDPANPHASNQGFGPWEIDISHLFATDPAELTALIQARYANTASPNDAPNPRGIDPSANFPRYFQPTGQTAHPQVAPPSYSRVDWNGAPTTGATAKMILPGDTAFGAANAFGTLPRWPNQAENGPYDNSNYTTASPVSGEEAYRHPSLFNPFERNPLTTSTLPGTAGTFPLADLKQFAGRYSDLASNYGQTYLGRQATPQLCPTVFGAAGGSGPASPANVNRQLVTAISNSLKRAGLAPNVFGASGGGLILPAPSDGQIPPPTWANGTAPTANLTSAESGPSDIRHGSPNDVRAITAALGAIDVNRPLTDYRTDLNTPLGVQSTTNATDTLNIGNQTMAQAERQQLARDIFARLLVATGMAVLEPSTITTVPARIDPTTGAITIVTAEIDTTGTYNALRWMAQLAVNIVDYIDNDDIMTQFEWNTAVGVAFNNKYVFGVEKPRLVINEAYAEMANHTGDRSNMSAGQNFQLRYYIELLNPGSTEASGMSHPLAGPDAARPGSVALRYGTTIACYRIEVYSHASNTMTDLLGGGATPNAVPGNVKGDAPNGVPVLVGGYTDFLAAPAGLNADRVEPNDGAFAATGAARNGFAVVCPQINPADSDGEALFPDTTVNPAFGQVIQLPALGHDTGSSAIPDDIPTTVGQENNNGGHAVLLRRLACPYLAHDPITNPYITVDFQARIPVNDAVRIGQDPPGPPDGTRVGGVPPKTGRVAIGRAQPFTAYGNPTAGATFPGSLVFRQQNLDSDAGNAPSDQQHTLFRHNSARPQSKSGLALGTTTPPTLPSVRSSTTLPAGETLWGPFEWITHPDRRLVSIPELLQVAAVKPHELTYRFSLPVGGQALLHGHTASSAGMSGTVSPATGVGPVASPLYRALELLTVKPWTYNAPEGGRTAGRINVNMIWDEEPDPATPTDATRRRSRVLYALMGFPLPPTTPNTPNQFTDDDLLAVWNGIKQHRSPGMSPANLGDPTLWVGTTRNEDSTLSTADRPIRGFGTPLLAAAPGSIPAGSGSDDTLLHLRTSDGAPLFSRVPPAAPNPPLHPYLAQEPLQKAFNNLTTVSDTYLVIYTVGFFEVRNPGPWDANNPPVLGHEAYSAVPGDLRAQFMAVIDRTQFGVNNDTTPQQVSTVWTGELVTQAVVLPTPSTTLTFPVQRVDNPTTPTQAFANSDGQEITIQNLTWLRLGTGDSSSNLGDGEWVQVTGINSFDPNTGLVTVQLAAPGVTRHHPAGSPVSNALMRNPGPQTGFDPTATKYRGLVPFFQQVSP